MFDSKSLVKFGVLQKSRTKGPRLWWNQVGKSNSSTLPAKKEKHLRAGAHTIAPEEALCPRKRFSQL
jgi:hypothetical protein